MSLTYEQEKQRYRKYFAADTGRSGKEEEIRTTPLFSLKAKHAVDRHRSSARAPSAKAPFAARSISFQSRASTSEAESSEVQSRSSYSDSVSAASQTQSEPRRPTDIAHKSPESTDSISSSSVATSSHTESSRGASSAPAEQPTEETQVLPQYGLLGHHVGDNEHIGPEEPILLNVNAPNSAFICGSQGSGKSYTLSCMLETCLLATGQTGKVTKPVAGVIFNYDSNSTPSVAEAAYLCSRGVKVNILTSPGNPRLAAKYRELGKKYGHVKVRSLLFRSADLTVDRMNKLMAVAEGEGPIPLYLELIQKILREMAKKGTFSYSNFKKQALELELTPQQKGPMNQRLALLESFMHEDDVPAATNKKNKQKAVNAQANQHLFDLKPGTLTVVDLTDTFVDASTACLLFDICLGLAQEQRPDSGLMVTLDEAHRFLTKTSAAAELFTESLLTTIRTQRHTATRVIIATQEPTISERLLDLCSISIIHRFNSPAWFDAIKGHLAGASTMVSSPKERDDTFQSIVDLNVGESLVFSPSSFVEVGEEGDVQKLGTLAMMMKTRQRVGVDVGMSVLAEGMGDLGI